jgi:hypothetical protein
MLIEMQEEALLKLNRRTCHERFAGRGRDTIDSQQVWEEKKKKPEELFGIA